MTTIIRPVSLALLGLMLVAAPCYGKTKHTRKTSATTQAQKTPPQNAPPSDMIDISADESLEWYQDTHLYVARGKAKAIHGDMTIEADLLSAHQREAPIQDSQPSATPTGSGNIDRMTAEGNVHMYDSKQQVFGEHAVYDADQKLIKITGSNLKYMTAKDTVTAKDSLEYYEEKKVAVARGRAMGEHDGSRVEADILNAEFGDAPGGQMEMKRLFAKGNVIIVTKDNGVSRGDQAVYDVKSDTAILTNHVRITRGETQLDGDKAEIDFASGQSRLLNNGGGRVRALLPSSGAKKEKSAP